MSIKSITAEIKNLLKDITVVTDETERDDSTRENINLFENPLDPNLLAYCFDIILGFDVRYRIFEKVNYIIEFSYKGTFATVGHFKMSYDLSIDKRYKAELISIFKKVRSLLEELFMQIGEKALIDNEFSMKNETPDYFKKLAFYENKIETLKQREQTVRAKCQGKYDVTLDEYGYTHMRQKGSDYLRNLRTEIIYDIEAYIDTFFAALEHVLTLLYPFVCNVEPQKSYFNNYIRNTKWDWMTKIRNVFGSTLPVEIVDELRWIKEIYRNHNAHGGFSREMMAYVQIPGFGRLPMFVGKEYLKGFINGKQDHISYDLYKDAKDVFTKFWEALDNTFQIPMMFIRSGLAIPVDTERYTENVDTPETAQWIINKMLYDLDNQLNMDW